MHRIGRPFFARTFGAYASCVLLLGSCDLFGGSSDQNNALTGGSSDQGNAIQVRLLDRFGSPLPHASLEILPDGSLPGGGQTGSSVPNGFRRVTDSNGTAKLDLPSGSYAFHGRFEHLASIFSIQVTSDRTVELVLRAASDVVGTLSTAGVDTLFIPGTRRFALVQPDGSFRLDSLPEGARVLSTRDGRTLRLDSAGSGFVREYRSSMSVGNTSIPVPDTLIPKYFATRRGPLPLEATRPTEVLASWIPDSVWVSGDTIWISSLVRACDALPKDGLAAWWHAESLDVFKRPCPVEQGEPVRHLFHQTPRTGIWTVGTLQPFGYTWEMP